MTRMPKYGSMRLHALLLSLALPLLVLLAPICPAQKRMVLIDQDGSGPGGSNQMAMLSLLQSPQVEVLGITMVTGNAWRDEETLSSDERFSPQHSTPDPRPFSLDRLV